MGGVVGGIVVAIAFTFIVWISPLAQCSPEKENKFFLPMQKMFRLRELREYVFAILSFWNFSDGYSTKVSEYLITVIVVVVVAVSGIPF